MTNGLQAPRQEDLLLLRERAFFDALIQADIASLTQILAEDFTLIDLNGGQMTKDQLLGLLENGQLKFLSIAPQGGMRIRVYGSAAAVVTGRTVMTMQFMGEELSVESRYTHVYAEEAGAWRLEIAQGTPLQLS